MYNFCVFFVSLRYEEKKTTCTLYYENVYVGFFFSFIPQGNENKSTVNSYNLISYHFHTKAKGKQP